MRIITLLLTALTFTSAMAQSHVQEAIDRLKSDNVLKMQRSSISNKNNHRTGLLEIYTFDTLDDDDLAMMVQAFADDRVDAYNYVCHNSGEPRQRYAIYYDESNSIVVGKDDDDNYLLLSVVDPGDSDNKYRYCYVMEWAQNRDNSASGRVIKTYAPKPQSRSAQVLLQGLENDLNEIDVYSDSTLLKSLGVLMSGSDGENSSTFELGNGKTGFVWRSSHDHDDDADEVEWLTSFNHYRNAFLKAAKKKRSSATSYASSILKLCKTADSTPLTAGERELCRKSIKEMQKATDDSFIKGLLDEALHYLK